MLPPKKILFPIDYSDRTDAVIPFVKEIQDRFSAELALVHAYGPDSLALVDLALGDPRLPAAVREMEQNRLREFALAKFPGRSCAQIVCNGDAGRIVKQAIDNVGCNLVMLPTHGRGIVRRLLLGSVTAKILHDADCAVWTANDTGLSNPIEKLPYRYILCALDESEDSEAALRGAGMLAERYHAHLSLIHVLEMPGAIEVEYSDLHRRMRQEAEERLRERAAQLSVNPSYAVLDGVVAEAISEEATRVHADLIVTGRGRIAGPVSRLWAQLYSVVRDAPCPLISV